MARKPKAPLVRVKTSQPKQHPLNKAIRANNKKLNKLRKTK